MSDDYDLGKSASDILYELIGEDTDLFFPDLEELGQGVRKHFEPEGIGIHVMRRLLDRTNFSGEDVAMIAATLVGVSEFFGQLQDANA